MTGATLAVVDPATALPFTELAAHAPADVSGAVDAAVRAQRSWRRASLAERRALLTAVGATIEVHREELARLLTLEQGKPLEEALGEVDGACSLFAYYAGYRTDDGERLFEERGTAHVRHYTPLGVVAGIIPWNFPFLIAAMKIAPALLTGNAIVVKPAPTTPATTARFMALIAALVPSGLVQVLVDAGELGPLLAAHDDVRKVAFTGSTVNGRRVMAAAAPTLKRLTLELGGNDAAVVLDDADVEATAAGIMRGAFRNCGQICGAIKRVYVADALHDALVEALSAHVRALVVGSGLTPGVTTGPVQNRVHHDKSMRLLDAATAQGHVAAQATVPHGDGFFVPPTLVSGLVDTHALVAEEQFAPLLPVLRYSDMEEAVARANGTPFGLTASVWTADAARGEATARALQVGMVCINRHNESGMEHGISMAAQSGTGWLLGDEGVREYLQSHLVNL
jgi:acyl-CoA reductase-like NAD-dependent aldehyde dehydrogenase